MNQITPTGKTAPMDQLELPDAVILWRSGHPYLFCKRVEGSIYLVENGAWEVTLQNLGAGDVEGKILQTNDIIYFDKYTELPKGYDPIKHDYNDVLKLAAEGY